MKKVFFGVMILLVVWGCSLVAKKAGTSARGTTNASTAATSQEPIILDDYADFQFTPGWNVPGTLFQADFKWGNQNGRTVYLYPLSGGQVNLDEVERRFDFSYEDIVTVVFKVRSARGSRTHHFDFVSIEKK